MDYTVCRICLTLSVLGLLASVSHAADGDSALEQAILGGKTHIEFRYRYELVDQDTFTNNANASTLKLRLNYETAKWNGWSAFIEADHVAEVLLNDYNSGAGTSPGRTQYPVVADPEGTDLNQLFVDYSGVENMMFRIGRQRILLDNQRFVGGVGWRQNEQTFDGLSLKYWGLKDTELFYSYVGNVNRIFGDTVPAGDHEQNTHLLNAAFKLSDDWSVTGYGYYIDNEDSPVFSTSTVGIRTNGQATLNNGTLTLLGEFARQSDAANGPVSYDANYLRAELGLAFNNGLKAGVGLESMGGSATVGGSAFRTPLATLHAFDGWADQFLTTPDAGLKDLFASVGYKIGRWSIDGVYHDFSAESGGDDLGTEINLSTSRKIRNRYSASLIFAGFKSDNGAYTDTTKIWLMFTGKY